MRYQAALRPDMDAIIRDLAGGVPGGSAAQQDQHFFQFLPHLLDDLVAQRRFLAGTLALQAVHRPTQRWLIGVFKHPLVRFLTHPVTAWLLFGTTMCVFVEHFTRVLRGPMRSTVPCVPSI